MFPRVGWRRPFVLPLSPRIPFRKSPNCGIPFTNGLFRGRVGWGLGYVVLSGRILGAASGRYLECFRGRCFRSDGRLRSGILKDVQQGDSHYYEMEFSDRLVLYSRG